MKLKWWQWGLIGFGGLVVLTAIFGEPPPPPATSAKTREFARLDPEFRQIGRGMWAMTFDPGVDPDALPQAARDRCGSLDFCSIYGWVEPEFAARGFPFTDREAARQVFVYTVNRNSGLDQPLWDCERWPRTTADQCIAR